MKIVMRVADRLDLLQNHPLFRLGILVLPSVVALSRGLVEWQAQRASPLASDAEEYLGLASAFGPTSLIGGLREPLWPALMAPLAAMCGPVPDAARLLGVAGFVVMVLSFQFAAWRLFGRTLGAVAAILIASSPWLLFQAPRGLREEMAAGLVLLIGLVVARGQAKGRAVALLGLLAGSAAMLRWDTLLLSLPVIVLSLVSRRAGVQHWITALGVLSIVVSPLVIGNWILNGDPMYQSNVHAKFFRNLEFAGKPGFPTVEDVEADSLAGPSITWAAYLFGLHGPSQLARQTISGVVRTPYTEIYKSVFYPSTGIGPGDLSSPLRYFRLVVAASLVVGGVVGGTLLLFGTGWVFGVILFISSLEFAPIAEIADPRLFLTCIPFLFIGNLQVLVVLVSQHRRREIAVRFRAVRDFVSYHWLWWRAASKSGTP